MKNLEKIKWYAGLALTSYAVLGGLIFYLESWGILDKVFSFDNQSRIWEDGFGEGSGASHTPIFLGLCGLAGAYLLASIKPVPVQEIKVANDPKAE
jgi:hypothetical protein